MTTFPLFGSVLGVSSSTHHVAVPASGFFADQAVGAQTSWIARRWWMLAGLVLMLSAATSLLGLSTLALESHEVYVARTVEETQARSQWLVPVFNDAVRLKKPPLMYWLVMGADALANDGPIVTEATARLPSAAASLLVVLLTMVLGRRLFGPVEGLLAGLALTASSGMFSYSHSARPEMVYALWCHLAMLCLVNSAQLVDQRQGGLARWWAWGAWAALGLAAMTKGPHFPALLIIGWTVALAVTGRKNHIAESLRPWSGLMILVLIGGWWYAAIWLTQSSAVTAWQLETISRYRGEGIVDSPWKMLNPYYAYRTAGLLLPWVALYGLALAAPAIIKTGRQRQGVVWLWWIVVIAMLGLSLSLGRRWYYMLPLIGPLALLGVVGALEVGRRFWQGRQRGIVAGTIIAHVAAVAMYEFWVHVRDDDAPAVSQWAGAFFVALAAGCAGGWMFAQSRKRRAAALPILLTVMFVVGALFFIDVAFDQQVWRDARDEHRAFGLAVVNTIKPADTIIGWQNDWPVQQYYLHRPIPVALGKLQLRDAVDRHGQFWLLVDTHDSPSPCLSASLEKLIVLTREHEGDRDRLQLWHIVQTN